MRSSKEVRLKGMERKAHVMQQIQKQEATHVSAANSMRSAVPERQQTVMAKFSEHLMIALWVGRVVENRFEPDPQTA